MIASRAVLRNDSGGRPDAEPLRHLECFLKRFERELNAVAASRGGDADIGSKRASERLSEQRGSLDLIGVGDLRCALGAAFAVAAFGGRAGAFLGFADRPALRRRLPPAS